MLPDGVEFILSGPLQSTFTCENAGYYADLDNNCEVFHICDVSINPEGEREVRQYSFACGNKTIFNQLTLTCALPDESIPCSAAPQFYRMNEKLGVENIPFHTEDDLLEAAKYIPANNL